MKLAVAVYRVTARFPAEERFGLTSQLRRAATSAAANIAEGCARTGAREFARFLAISMGSLAEIDTLLEIASEAGPLVAKDKSELDAFRDEASRTTYGLLRSVQHKS